MIDLPAFLRDALASREPWNCSTMPADWCVANGCPDFAAEWREVVDLLECEARPAEAGGLVHLWDRGIGDGLSVVDEAQAGDIGVIAIGHDEAGAVFTGERWAIQGARTLHFLGLEQVRAVKVWRVSHV